MAKPMKISQETFDEVVRENIEDFEQEPAAAISDAISQFEKQGVDLSNIDTSGGIGREEMMDAISTLEANNKNNATAEAILANLTTIRTLTAKTHDMSSRNKNLLREKGLNSLHLLMEPTQGDEVLIATFELIDDLSKDNLDTRDFFEPGGCARLDAIMKSREGKASPLIVAALKLARTVAKSENNKVMLMRAGMGDLIASILRRGTEEQATGSVEGTDDASSVWTSMMHESCQLLRGLCVHDDLRKDMSCAYDNGRFFIKQAAIAPVLMKLGGNFKKQPLIASAALKGARNLITTEESVGIMARHGALELPAAIMKESDSPSALVGGVIGLMRNLCADDKRKDRLVADGTLELLINVMNQHEGYAADASLIEHALACLAAMSLRSPGNSQRIVDSGMAVDIIVKNMRRHKDRAALQRQGCLLIRNIAGRCPELRPMLMDAGIEDILRAAGRHMDVVDEAYAALRDLGVEVQYVKVNAESGKIEAAYEQFGAKSKLQFNPVYDADPSDAQIMERVQQEAHAPLAAPNLRQVGDSVMGYDGEDNDDDLMVSGSNVKPFSNMPPPPAPGAAATVARSDSDHGHDHAHDHVHGPDCHH